MTEGRDSSARKPPPDSIPAPARRLFDAMPRGPEHGPAAQGLERLVFFSDAVFAIAITLLVIDLRLPEPAASYTDATFVDALLRMTPALFAFALSFAIVAAFWIGHLRTFRAVVRSDARLVAINLAFLFFVALLPFPTSVIAREGNLPAAAILYALFGVAASLLSASLWVYPTRIARLATPFITPDLARHVTYRALAVPVVFAVSIPIALASPFVAEASWLAIFPLESLLSRRFGLQHALDVALGGAVEPAADRPPEEREGVTR